MPTAVQGAAAGINVNVEQRTPAGVTCMDAVNSAVRVNVVAGGGAGGTASNFGAAFPAQGTAAGFLDAAGNMEGAEVHDLDTGGGVENNLGASLRTGGAGGSVETGVLLQPLRIDPVGTTSQPVDDGAGSLTVDDGGGALSIDDNGGSLTVDGTVAITEINQDDLDTGGGVDNQAIVGIALAEAGGHVMVGSATPMPVNIIGGGGGGTASAFGAAFPAQGTAVGFLDLAGNMAGGTVHDLDLVGTENNIGVSLREAAPGGSVATGVAGNALRIDPTGATAQPVTDNAGSLTVDDGGGSLTIDGTVAITEINQDDLDTGGGVDNQAIVGIGLAEAGGHTLVGSANPMPINDAGGSITVDGTVAVTGAGTSSAFGAAIPAQGTAAGFLDAAGLMREAEVHDLDTGGGTEFNLGVSLRTGGAGASYETGVLANPLRVDPTGTTPQPVENETHNKTVESDGGTAAINGNNTLIAAVAGKKIKVKAFSLTTVSTAQVTCIFQDGAGGAELWRVTLKAPSTGMAGANLAVPLPDWLFETSVNTLLNLNLSAAQTIHWAVSYIEEA